MKREETQEQYTNITYGHIASIVKTNVREGKKVEVTQEKGVTGRFKIVATMTESDEDFARRLNVEYIRLNDLLFNLNLKSREIKRNIVKANADLHINAALEDKHRKSKREVSDLAALLLPSE